MSTRGSLPFGLHIESNHSMVGIPYKTGKREDGETFPFVSLVEKPEKIDSIPELEGQPELKGLIAHINRQEADFETIRVVHYSTENNWEFALGFVFRDAELQSNPHSYMMFLWDFMEHCRRFPSGDTGMVCNFDLQRFHWNEKAGWIADLSIRYFDVENVPARTLRNEHLRYIAPIF